MGCGEIRGVGISGRRQNACRRDVLGEIRRPERATDGVAPRNNTCRRRSQQHQHCRASNPVPHLLPPGGIEVRVRLELYDSRYAGSALAHMRARPQRATMESQLAWWFGRVNTNTTQGRYRLSTMTSPVTHRDKL